MEAIQRLRRYRDDVGAPAGGRDPRPARRRRRRARGRCTSARCRRSSASPASSSTVADPDGALGEAHRRDPGRDRRAFRVDAGGRARPARGAAEDVREPRSSAPRASSRTRASSRRRPPELVQQEREKLERYRARARRARALGDRWRTVRSRPTEAERYLLSLELFGMRFGLERMRRLMTALDSPHERFASVHVVGHERQVVDGAHDRGACSQRHGLRTGAYLSPHLTSFAERVEVEGARSSPRALRGRGPARRAGSGARRPHARRRGTASRSSRRSPRRRTGSSRAPASRWP